MNKEAFERTRDLIMENREHYCQALWAHVECGTPACVAGFACVAHDGKITEGAMCITPDKRYKQISEYAAEVLGLSDEDAHWLFHEDPFGSAYSTGRPHPTADDAIATLNRAIETGVVRWIQATQ